MAFRWRDDYHASNFQVISYSERPSDPNDTVRLSYNVRISSRCVLLRLLLFVCEIQRNRIDAMAFIDWSIESFSLEDVTKVSAAGSTSDLNPRHAQRTIFMARNGSRNSIKECRPSTTTIELRGALVQWCSTSAAGISTLLFKFLVFACSRSLGTLLAKNTELLSRKNSSPLAFALGLAGISHDYRTGVVESGLCLGSKRRDDC